MLARFWFGVLRCGHWIYGQKSGTSLCQEEWDLFKAKSSAALTLLVKAVLFVDVGNALARGKLIRCEGSLSDHGVAIAGDLARDNPGVDMLRIAFLSLWGSKGKALKDGAVQERLPLFRLLCFGEGCTKLVAVLGLVVKVVKLSRRLLVRGEQWLVGKEQCALNGVAAVVRVLELGGKADGSARALVLVKGGGSFAWAGRLRLGGLGWGFAWHLWW